MAHYQDIYITKILYIKHFRRAIIDHPYRANSKYISFFMNINDNRTSQLKYLDIRISLYNKNGKFGTDIKRLL